MEFDRGLGSSAAEASVKFQSDMIILTPNLTVNHKIWWYSIL